MNDIYIYGGRGYPRLKSWKIWVRIYITKTFIENLISKETNFGKLFNMSTFQRCVEVLDQQFHLTQPPHSADGCWERNQILWKGVPNWGNKIFVVFRRIQATLQSRKKLILSFWFFLFFCLTSAITTAAFGASEARWFWTMKIRLIQRKFASSSQKTAGQRA